MIDLFTHEYMAALVKIPSRQQRNSIQAHRKWSGDNYYPSLHFKKLNTKEKKWYCLRVSDEYRTLGFREGEIIKRHWIGPRYEYDEYIKKL